jgi:hypothetical protein
MRPPCSLCVSLIISFSLRSVSYKGGLLYHLVFCVSMRPCSIIWKYAISTSQNLLFQITAYRRCQNRLPESWESPTGLGTKNTCAGEDRYQLPYRPRLYIVGDRMINECEVASWIRIGRGNVSSQRSPTPVSLLPPQILHDLTWDWTSASAVGSLWLSAWAMDGPYVFLWFLQ